MVYNCSTTIIAGNIGIQHTLAKESIDTASNAGP